jgi:hypothetical protein
MDAEHESHLWRAVGIGAGFAAGLVTRKTLEAVWQATRGQEPPSNPASPQTTWAEAIIWAVASGVSLAVTRLVAQRGAAEAWKAVKGSYPEGLEEVRP